MTVKQSLSSCKVVVFPAAPEFGIETKRWLSGNKGKHVGKLQYVTSFTHPSLKQQQPKAYFDKSALKQLEVSRITFMTLISNF